MGEEHTTGPARVSTSDDLLRLAIDDVPIFVFAVDREGILTLARGRCEWAGNGPVASELAGRSLFELYGDHTGLADDLRRALAGERVRNRHRVDGLPFAAQHIPVLDGSGAVVGATGWHLEVSELARAEEQHAFLARAVQHASDGVLVIDAHRVVRYANAAYERITGYPMHELVGRPVALLQSERADPTLCRRIDDSIQTESRWKGCLIGRRKDGGDYEAHASISAVRDASGSLAGTVCVARDTTDLDRLQRRLERAQRLEAIGRLAGGIAHNFNNLLTAILGYSEMCEAQAEPGGGVAEGLVEIRQAAERGSRLIAQMLALSHKQPVHRRPIVLRELLWSLDEMLRRIIPETIELRVRCDDGDACLLGDRGQIEQVVLNLVVNAVDAMPRGGVLTLVGGREPLDGRGQGVASGLPPGDYAVLGVEDTGVGMSELQLEQIFEPFYTTKEIGRATGLGLATVHSIVDRCGGAVRVTSQPGRGTAFRVYFPTPTSAATTRVDVAEVDPSAPRQETVLYVEDDFHVRTVVARMLRRLGYRALVAGDAEEALAAARENGASIDLLLTDVVMPRRSGIDLADDVRGLVPHARVLFVSGYTSDALHPQLLDEPGVGFLAKPFQSATLDRALRSLLDAPKGLSPA